MVDRPQRTRLPILPTATLPSCLWSLSVVPSLPASRLTNFHRQESVSSLTTRQITVEFHVLTFSRSHARFPFRKEEETTQFLFSTRIKLSTSALLPISHLLWSIGLNVLGYQSHLYCNVALLSVVTKNLPISPRFSPYEFSSRRKFSSRTTRQITVEFHVLTRAFRFGRKEEETTQILVSTRIKLSTSALLPLREP